MTACLKSVWRMSGYGPRADICQAGARVRYWHVTDIDADAEHVRSWVEADILGARSNVR